MRLSHLDIAAVSKSFGAERVLAAASLQVERGTTTALLGPSGCGKTTLLRIIAGLESPDEGTVQIGGRLVVGSGRSVAPERRRVGMVFQDGALFPHLRVGANVAYGLSKAEVKSGRVGEVLEMVDLAGFENREPAGLSGGQAQRVALARALARRPSVLLLDEPFSSLDAELRVRVRAELVRLLRELEVTTVFVTHDQEEAFVVGDRVAVMNGGKIVQEGTPDDIYAHPHSEWLAAFVGEANLLPATAHTAGAATGIGVIPTQEPLQTGGKVLVRPEYLQLAPGNMGVVESVEFYGHDTAYEISGLDSPLLVRELRAPRFRVGDGVNVAYAGGPAIVFVWPICTTAIVLIG